MTAGGHIVCLLVRKRLGTKRKVLDESMSYCSMWGGAHACDNVAEDQLSQRLVLALEEAEEKGHQVHGSHLHQ